MSKRLLVGLFVLALAGCDEVASDAGLVPAGVETAKKPDAAKEYVKNPAILPAYKLPWEDRVPGKQDAASDFRKAHPQWYAITVPPPAQYRPMKEWEPMQANIITYSNYLPGDNPVATTMAQIVALSLPAGEVWVVVDSDQAKADLINRVKKEGVAQSEIDAKVKFFKIENNAIWTIDFGPLPMVDDASGDMVFQDFRYYHERVLDDAISTRLANRIGVTTYRSPFDFEGGNFQADGEEYCYTTERLYYYTGLNFDQVQKVFQTYYGCKKAVVLKDITDDGTGHVDMFFKLGSKQVAFMGEYTVVNDPTNKKRMDDNAKQLAALVYSDGSPGLTVLRIPFPNPAKYGQEKIPRTFINSTLFASTDGKYKVNLWPIYTVDKDLEAQALDAWKKGLPDWDHKGIICDQISTYSGDIHCVTRTVPALPLAKTIADGECGAGYCQGVDDGYDGFCIASSEEDPGCWGPKWDCACNVCETAGCKIPASCGDGTCGNQENCLNCAKDCGCAGQFEVCNPVTAKCVEALCGNGVCDPGENCVTCIPDCGCSGAEKCSYGVCSHDPCGGIEYAGCCDGKNLVYCDGGDLVVNNCGSNGCGWVAGQAWYDCGGKGEDPSGKLALDCFDYEYPPGCGGKECGDNGGGYSCGTCPQGQDCVDGKCGDCMPDCQGKECGDNGCGAACGECQAGFECSAQFKCVCVPACEGKNCGDDGCGATCGECQAGYSCSPEGTCIQEPTPESETDIITEEDLVVAPEMTSDEGSPAEDTVTPADEGNEEEPAKKGGDGICSAPAGGNAFSALLVLCLAFVVIRVRRTVLG